MTPLVPIVLWGWPPAVVWLYSKLTPRRAAIAGFLLAWMFLPQYAYPFPGLPKYGKVMAACLGILLGTAIFDPDRIKSFRFRSFDVPMVLWCLSPVLASITNDLGLYDGLSAMKNYLMLWAFPYYIGRLYFRDLTSLRELVIGAFLGGVVYIPFCLIEIVISPQLHNIAYGFHPADFSQSLRGGGYRPVVFMAHGLMVGMWMITACLTGLRLLSSGLFPTNLPFLNMFKPSWIMLALLATTVLCKSTGALGLLLVGLAVIIISTKFRTPVLVYVLILLPVLYMTTRGTGSWDGMNAVSLASQLSEHRAASLQYRLDNENLLIDKALEKPVFGWGGWGRSRVYGAGGRDITVTDGYWIIVLGTTGLFGIVTFTLIVLTPVLIFLRRYPVQSWSDPPVCAVVSLPILLCLFMIDNLLNAMPIPIYMLIAGGLSNLAETPEAGGEGAAMEQTAGDAEETGKRVPRTRFL